MKTFFVLLAILAAALPAASAAEATIKSKVVDAATNSVTETISDTKGKIIKKTVFYFDQHNWTTGAVHYDTAGKVKYKESFRRNAAGQMTETFLYSADDRLLGRRVMAYDGKGNVSKLDDYDAAGRLIPKAVRASPATTRRATSGKRR